MCVYNAETGKMFKRTVNLKTNMNGGSKLFSLLAC